MPQYTPLWYNREIGCKANNSRSENTASLHTVNGFFYGSIIPHFDGMIGSLIEVCQGDKNDLLGRCFVSSSCHISMPPCHGRWHLNRRRFGYHRMLLFCVPPPKVIETIRIGTNRYPITWVLIYPYYTRRINVLVHHGQPMLGGVLPKHPTLGCTI